jgi:hypothetical protein
MKKVLKNISILAIVIVLLSSSLLYGARNPKLLVDSNPRPEIWGAAVGPTIKYKRISGPYDFGGDMFVWGIRAFGGKASEPKLGLMYSSGSLSGTGFKFNLQMSGLTLEDSILKDSRVKWRASFGGGKYEMTSKNSGYVVNKGSFTFLEPMLVGVLPMSNHIVLEFGVGYTFAGATGVRIEGLALQAELLMGKF